VVPQPFDLQESWMQGAESRCDLQQLRIDVEKAEIDLRYRRNQLFPSLDLIAGYGRRGSSTDQVLPPLTPSASLDAAYHQITGGDEPNDVLGVSFSVPLGRVAERGNFRASKELKVQAETRLRQFEELVFREIADAIDTASSNLERVGRARFSREMAAAALDAEERKLEGGKSTIFVVLQLQGQLATAQSTELRAKADYNRAVSQLHFAEGSLLDQLRLQLNFD
jgi:outer membrane protein TolC